MGTFINKGNDSHINDDVKAEILATYPDVHPSPNDDLMDVLRKAASLTGKKFIMIIDEWDAICRESRRTQMGWTLT